ncbi:hypothetical protein AVEN_220986-1 [Araneus ventricosus]|uniref:Uncharacterized protein n=1 Tax=Araneus ventricosus TaxID=182803 RepID=A0A4Y2EPF3_ARAVE|nr:hypothetical protein AVEN_220986-1 [Araneus ventricosus]
MQHDLQPWKLCIVRLCIFYHQHVARAQINCETSSQKFPAASCLTPYKAGVAKTLTPPNILNKWRRQPSVNFGILPGHLVHQLSVTENALDAVASPQG